MKPLAALLLLAACTRHEPLPLPPAPVPEVERCRAGVAQSPAPPLPRTIDTIVAAYNRAKAAGLATEAALKDCSAKVDLLLGR
jgi:hypothetical protein